VIVNNFLALFPKEGEMSNLTLYLIRHGESVANVERVFAARKIDPPLSEIGIQQATMQAKSLREMSVKSQFEFSALYASPLLRAKHTANIVGQHCGLEPILSDDLMEIDVGILDGEYQEDKVKWSIYEGIIEKWNQGLHNFGFPGGESLDDVKFRFSRFLNDALLFREKASLENIQSKQGRHILIVGHCLLFMAVIWLFCENHGFTLEDGHMGRGHLSIISQNNDRFRLLKFNLSPESPMENR
jgi:broad specificity phosphatase PhoE